MEEKEKLNAEVIAVLPNKVKISVDDLENFQLAAHIFGLPIMIMQY